MISYVYELDYEYNNKSQSVMYAQSHSNIQKIYTEQEETYKAFAMSNFYRESRLNIQQLKQRIQQKKRKQYLHANIQTSGPIKNGQSKGVITEPTQDYQTPLVNNSQIAKDKSNDQQPRRRYTQTKQKAKGRMNGFIKKQFKSTEQTDRKSNKPEKYPYELQTYLISKKPSGSQLDGKTISSGMSKNRVEEVNVERNKTLAGKGKSNMTFYEHAQSRLKSRFDRTKTQLDDSRYTGSEFHSLSAPSLERCISIDSIEVLRNFQKKIMLLWNLYQLLSKILELVQNSIPKTRLLISKYREIVCSQKFQFILDILNTLQQQQMAKKYHQFMKRIRKAMVISRMLQHISIVLLAFSFYSSNYSKTHLSNIIGYASSNLINIIKFVLLIHYIEAPLKLSSQVQQKRQIINSFEVGSYGGRLNKIPQVVLRLEQNNNVMVIVKGKLLPDRQMQTLFSGYLKTFQASQKCLEDYAHYIFEYLSFCLANRRMFGYLPQIQISPAPYLNLQKRITLVIEPWHVLVSMRDGAAYIRAYTQQFIKSLSNYCNIVYWTDLMPDQINPLLQKLPAAHHLFQYHCRRDNGLLIKTLSRLGSDLENTIIVDRQESNFMDDKAMGLELPWRGTKRDTKLLILLELLQEIFAQQTQLRQSFPSIKAIMMSKNPRQRGRIVRTNGGKPPLRPQFNSISAEEYEA